MRILLVISFFSEKFGGSVVSTYNLSKELANNGHQITIITSNYEFDTNYANSLKEKNITIISFDTLFNINSLIYTPSIKKWIKININNYDIIYLNNFRSYQNFIVYKYGRNKIPLILHPRGDFLPYFEKKFLKQLFDFFCGYDMIKNADKLIVSSLKERDDYLKLGINEKKIEILPNAITLDNGFFSAKKNKFRKKYNFHSETKIILFLSRIHKIKGIDYLIDGFNMLINEQMDANLVIIGPDAGFLDKVKEKIISYHLENKIMIIDPLFGKEKYEAFLDADVYILPSRYESFGNTLLEAIVCETPVITTNYCNICDLISNLGGEITDLNPKQIKNSIQKTFYMYNKNKEARIYAKNYVLKELNWKTIIKRYETLFDQIIIKT